jgi:hypothetical protein
MVVSWRAHFFSIEQCTLMISFLEIDSIKSSVSLPCIADDVTELDVESEDEDEPRRGDRIDAVTEAEAGGAGAGAPPRAAESGRWHSWAPTTTSPSCAARPAARRAEASTANSDSCLRRRWAGPVARTRGRRSRSIPLAWAWAWAWA